LAKGFSSAHSEIKSPFALPEVNWVPSYAQLLTNTRNATADLTGATQRNNVHHFTFLAALFITKSNLRMWTLSKLHTRRKFAQTHHIL
jgi:hypothetical protein